MNFRPVRIRNSDELTPKESKNQWVKSLADHVILIDESDFLLQTEHDPDDNEDFDESEDYTQKAYRVPLCKHNHTLMKIMEKDWEDVSYHYDRHGLMIPFILVDLSFSFSNEGSLPMLKDIEDY